jgi:DNA modification methylase
MILQQGFLLGNCLHILEQLSLLNSASQKNNPAEFVDLTFTSPPYFNAMPYSHYTSYESYLSFLASVFAHVHTITIDGGFCVVNTSPVLVARTSRNASSKRLAIPFELHGVMLKIGWDFVDDIIWQKPEGAVSNRAGVFHQGRKPKTYKPNSVTEYVLVYRKGDNIKTERQLKKSNPEVIADSLVLGEYERTNVWNISPRADKQHPAVFPDLLAQKIIQYYSLANDLVLDPFGGIGTTALNAYRLRRRYLSIECNPEYHISAIERLSKML